MSTVWNGSTLRDNYCQENGFTDTTSKARTLRYMNEIQKDIASGFDWPNLKFKLKKLIASDSQGIDISPQIPSAPSVAASAGGALTADSACLIKVTFVLFDEAGEEYSSIESQPSVASSSVTPTGANLTLTLTAIDTYDGSTTVKPTTIHRRIYLKQGTSDYLLSKTLEDNTTTTTTIAANPSSTIEPPEFSMVDHLADEDPIIQASGIFLVQENLDEILKWDPNLSATGTPRYYARVSPTKIFLYPRPSAELTISYWVFRRPSRIFADSDRAIQLDPSLETVLQVGTDFRWFKYKQESDWPEMRELYNQMKSEARNEKVQTGGQSLRIKVVY